MSIIDWMRTAFAHKKETVLPGKFAASAGQPADRPRSDDVNTTMVHPHADSQKTFYPVRRRFERFGVHGKELFARIVMTDIIELSDISTGGACIITTRPLHPGEKVLLTLPNDKISSALKCTIIWERAGEEPSRGRGSMTLHKAGLKFSDVDTGTIVRLKNFMYQSGTPSDQKKGAYFRPGPLRFSILSGEKAMLNYPSTSPVKTISRRGMLVESTAALDPDQRYPMVLYLPQNDRPIKFQGRIASRVPCGDAYDIGIEFLQMKKLDRDRLRSFVGTLPAMS
jgi:PilZ domain